MEILSVDPRQCRRWAYADRCDFEMGDLVALAQDIRDNGQIEPVLARPTQDDEVAYEIVAGSRRFQACQQGNLPLKIRLENLTDEEALIAQIKENQKEGLSDYSKGIFYAKMLAEGKATKASLLAATKLSRTQLDRYLTFQKVPDTLWRYVGNMSKVSVRAAQTIHLLCQKGEAYQEALFESADEIRKGIGSRRLESLVKRLVKGDEKDIETEASLILPDGQKIGSWTKNGFKFSEDIRVNQEKLSQVLLNFFQEESSKKTA